MHMMNQLMDITGIYEHSDIKLAYNSSGWRKSSVKGLNISPNSIYYKVEDKAVAA